MGVYLKYTNSRYTPIMDYCFDLIGDHLDTASFASLKAVDKDTYDLLSDISYLQNAEMRSRRIAYEVLELRQDVLMVGPGGCGKTYTINKILELGKVKDMKIAVCSTTGISACNFDGGSTLHSFAKMGLATMTMEAIQDKYDNTGQVMGGGKQWRAFDLLIVDEVSMLGRRFFEKLDLCARLARNSKQPFGGLQVLFSGDFLQLPPVMDSFVFTSERWSKFKFKVFHLDIPVRQSGDTSFYRMLNRIRWGKIKNRDIRRLKNRIIEKELPTDAQGFRVPTLYPRNKDINPENNRVYSSLPQEEERVVYANDSIVRRTRENGGWIYRPWVKMTIKQALKAAPKGYLVKYPTTIPLKKGAQYFLTFNVETGLGFVNGAISLYQGENRFLFRNGKVLEDMKEVTTFIPLGGNLYLKRSQLPLKLGYAVTIHSSQGMTLEQARIDIGDGVFTSAQTYVALSRVRRLDGVYLTSFNEDKIRCPKKAAEYYRKLLKVAQ